MNAHNYDLLGKAKSIWRGLSPLYITEYHSYFTQSIAYRDCFIACSRIISTNVKSYLSVSHIDTF